MLCEIREVIGTVKLETSVFEEDEDAPETDTLGQELLDEHGLLFSDRVYEILL